MQALIDSSEGINADTAEALDMLTESVTRYLADHCPFDPQRKLLGRPAWWKGLGTELDALSAAWPEAAGGVGAGMAAHAQMLRPLGAVLAAQPYVSTVVLCAGALLRSDSPLAKDLLAEVRAGTAVMAWAHAEPDGRHARLPAVAQLRQQGENFVLDGRKSVVRCAPWADYFLVSALTAQGRCTLVLVARGAAGVHLRPYATMDGGEAAEVQFEQVSLTQNAVIIDGDQAAEVIEALQDDATLALCAESLGVMDCLLNDSLNYARQRQQFGVPIASFQSVQHRLADMHMAFLQAQALTMQTAQQWEALTPSARHRAASSAKVMVGHACKAVGQAAVQIHGGMGMTEELAVGHYFRRATLISQELGSTQWHLRRLTNLDAA